MENASTFTANLPPFLLNPAAEAVQRSTSAANEQEYVRAGILARNALDLVDSLRENSLKLLKKGQLLSINGAASSVEALRAMWHAIMAFFRYLARVFGIGQKAEKAEGPAGSAPSGSGLAPAVGSEKKHFNDESDLQSNVAEMKSAIVAAEASKTPLGNAFLAALDAGGLTGADVALMQLVQAPGGFKGAQGPQSMLQAALGRADAALTELEAKMISAQAARAAAAVQVAQHQPQPTPPMLVEDLVSIYRLVDTAQVSDAEKSTIESLLNADKDLVAYSAHKKTISESMLIASAAALQAGADLNAVQPELLARVLGSQWQEQLKDAASVLNAENAARNDAASLQASAKSEVTSLLKRVRNSAMPTPAADVPTSTEQAVAEFLKPDEQQVAAQAKREALKARMRQAALNISQSIPTEAPRHFDDQEDGSDDSPTA